MKSTHPQPNSNLSARLNKALPEIGELVSQVGVSLMILFFKKKNKEKDPFVQMDMAVKGYREGHKAMTGKDITQEQAMDAINGNFEPEVTEEEPEIKAPWWVLSRREKFIVNVVSASFTLGIVTVLWLNQHFAYPPESVMSPESAMLWARATGSCPRDLRGIFADHLRCQADVRDALVGPNAPKDAGESLSYAATLALQEVPPGLGKIGQNLAEVEDAKNRYTKAAENLDSITKDMQRVQNQYQSLQEHFQNLEKSIAGKEVASVESNH